jgi:hypothetical protein
MVAEAVTKMVLLAPDLGWLLRRYQAEALVIQWDGAAAFIMMISYGFLLGTHVPAGLRSKRQRAVGLGLVAAQGALILTAYGLY